MRSGTPFGGVPRFCQVAVIAGAPFGGRRLLAAVARAAFARLRPAACPRPPLEGRRRAVDAKKPGSAARRLRDPRGAGRLRRPPPKSKPARPHGKKRRATSPGKAKIKGLRPWNTTPPNGGRLSTMKRLGGSPCAALWRRSPPWIGCGFAASLWKAGKPNP